MIQFSIGTVIQRPLYSGMEDHNDYVIVSILRPKETIPGVQDIRTKEQIDDGARWSYLCYNVTKNEDRAWRNFIIIPDTSGIRKVRDEIRNWDIIDDKISELERLIDDHERNVKLYDAISVLESSVKNRTV